MKYEKAKAWLLATVIMTLLGAVLYLMWEYAWRSFTVAEAAFFFYGFARFGADLGKWLLSPAPREIRKAEETDYAAMQRNVERVVEK